jgi:hypothetical protein
VKRTRAALMSFTVCAGMAGSALAQKYEVGPELWDRPRTGNAVREHEAIRRAITAALAQPEARLVIHHGGGHEPQLKAEELRAWLGALAIDPRRVALRGGLPASVPLTLEVLP